MINELEEKYFVSTKDRLSAVIIYKVRDIMMINALLIYDTHVVFQNYS